MGRCRWCWVLVLALALPVALGSRCNGDATPGPRNTHPIDTAPPKLVKEVPNGKLFSVGPTGDVKDLLHLWGTPRQNGVAMGQLVRDKVRRFIPSVYRYTEGQIVSSVGNATWCAKHKVRCDGLRDVLRLGLDAALDLSYRRTAPFIKPYVMQEIEGLASATGLRVADIRNVMWLGEITRGSCSMFGANGAATPDGRLLQLRALDWDVDGPFRNFASITIYHPNAGGGHAWANVGFIGFTASVTGFSQAQLGLSEIGVSFPDASFGPERYLAEGYPFGFLIRDILQFDASLAEATARIQGATRTCDLILGVGDGAANDFSGFQYSPSVATVVKPSTLIPANASWHPPIDDVVYWGMDWICPNDNRMLGHQLRRHHGDLTPELTVSDIVSYVATGDVHIAIYEHAAMHMYVATARPDGSSGPLPAYQRQFTRLDMAALFAEPPPDAAAPGGRAGCVDGSPVPMDVCIGVRCDTNACPCGCECGNATDPGVCYVPAEGFA